MTDEQELPVTFRPSLPYWILYGSLLFGFPILIILKAKVDTRDLPFLLSLFILSFSFPFLWLFQFIKITEENLIYSPFPFWPSTKVPLADLEAIFIISDYVNKKNLQLGIKDRKAPLKIPYTIYQQKDVSWILKILKIKSPHIKLDDSVENLYVQKWQKYKRPSN